MDDKRGLYAVTIIALILLFLMARKIGGVTVVNKDGDTIEVLSPVTQYNIPALTLPRGSAWDWMQTTDIACGCDVGLWKAPIFIETIRNVITSYPAYNYIGGNTVQIQPANPIFDVFTPPPPPTWHWEYGWSDSVGRYENRMYPVTEDGVVILTGKYGRNKIDAYGTYSTQTKDYTLNGNDLYVNGKRYVRSASQDQKRPPSYSEGKRDTLTRVMGGWDVPNPATPVYTVRS